jgi:hypothetical protein
MTDQNPHPCKRFKRMRVTEAFREIPPKMFRVQSRDRASQPRVGRLQGYQDLPGWDSRRSFRLLERTGGFSISAPQSTEQNAHHENALCHRVS